MNTITVNSKPYVAVGDVLALLDTLIAGMDESNNEARDEMAQTERWDYETRNRLDAQITTWADAAERVNMARIRIIQARSKAEQNSSEER